MYCKKCGGKLESYASHCAFCGTPVEKYNTEANYFKEEKTNDNAKPMTMWKWVGLFLLNGIPLVGNIIYIVLMFKWAFGTKADDTLKGFARANLLAMLAVLIIFAGLVVAIALFPELAEEIDNQIPTTTF